MDYYQYQLLLQQQQHQQQQPLQTLQQQAAKVGVPSLPSFGAAISQTPNQQSAASLLYNPSQIPQQSVVQSQVNFKDTQFLGQPSMQLQDFKIMGNLPQQQHQGFMGSDLNSQLQGFPGSSAAAGVSGGIDLSQQVFFQKAIQNQYINNIQQNRDDIIRNYINIISQNRNRNPSNDNRNRNPSNDNRNRNPSNENRNQPMTQVPQMNNILLQQTSSTAAAQNQFSAPQFASTFQAQQVFQQQQQVQQQQQLLAQQQQQLQKQQQPSTWMQGAVASLPELNKQFIGDVNFPTSAFQQQQQQQQQPARHSNHHLHHHLQQQQQQQFQMNMGINLNEMSALQQQQTMTDKVMNFAAQQQQQVHAAASAQKLSEDPLIDSFDKENIRLQQQITLLNGKLLQLNQSQSEILSLNNYSANKSLIDYLEQQIQLITSQKKQILEQIESLQTLKLAYTKFRQVCPEGSASQFMSLSKDTQLLFLTQQGAPQQVSPQSLPLTATSEVSALKIEHTPLQLHFSNEVHSTLQSSNSIQQQSQDDQKSVSSKNSNSSNQKKNPFKVIRSNENSEDIDIAYLNRKRETPVQSPSLSKVSAHHNDLAVESSQSQKEQPKEIQPEINHQVIPSEVAAVALQKDQEQQEAENKDSSIEDEKEMVQQNHEHNKIDEEDEDDDYDDDHNHDHGDMDNTSLAQTMSIAQKLSQMNPAESKKFEKRREKLEENVLKILEKSEDACSKIKPIALELCSKIAAESDVLKNRPYEAISAAVIVHASRLVANPITVKKMAKITESKEKIINRVFMYLKKNVEGFNNKMPQPEVFIKNICDKMKLTDAISKTAFFLHSQSDSLGLVKGQHAATVAACIVKLAACLNNMEMTVKQICEASNVCQISLRQLYRTIYPHRFELIGDHKINDIDFKKILNSPQMNLD